MYPREPQKLIYGIPTAGISPRFFLCQKWGDTRGDTNPGKKNTLKLLHFRVKLQKIGTGGGT